MISISRIFLIFITLNSIYSKSLPDFHSSSNSSVEKHRRHEDNKEFNDIDQINMEMDNNVVEVEKTTVLPVSHFMQLMNKDKTFPYYSSYILLIFSAVMLLSFVICILSDTKTFSTFCMTEDTLGRSTSGLKKARRAKKKKIVKHDTRGAFYANFLLARVPFSFEDYANRLAKAYKKIDKKGKNIDGFKDSAVEGLRKEKVLVNEPTNNLIKHVSSTTTIHASFTTNSYFQSPSSSKDAKKEGNDFKKFNFDMADLESLSKRFLAGDTDLFPSFGEDLKDMNRTPNKKDQQNSAKAPSKSPDKGPSKDPDKGPKRGPDKGPGRGPDKGPGRGPDKGPNRGPSKGQDKGPSKGPDKGPNRGPNKGPNRGPDKGAEKDPDKAEKKVPDEIPRKDHKTAPEEVKSSTLLDDLSDKEDKNTSFSKTPSSTNVSFKNFSETVTKITPTSKTISKKSNFTKTEVNTFMKNEPKTDNTKPPKTTLNKTTETPSSNKTSERNPINRNVEKTLPRKRPNSMAADKATTNNAKTKNSLSSENLDTILQNKNEEMKKQLDIQFQQQQQLHQQQKEQEEQLLKLNKLKQSIEKIKRQKEERNLAKQAKFNPTNPTLPANIKARPTMFYNPWIEEDPNDALDNSSNNQPYLAKEVQRSKPRPQKLTPANPHGDRRPQKVSIKSTKGTEKGVPVTPPPDLSSSSSMGSFSHEFFHDVPSSDESDRVNAFDQELQSDTTSDSQNDPPKETPKSIKIQHNTTRNNPVMRKHESAAPKSFGPSFERESAFTDFSSQDHAADNSGDLVGTGTTSPRASVHGAPGGFGLKRGCRKHKEARYGDNAALPNLNYALHQFRIGTSQHAITCVGEGENGRNRNNKRDAWLDCKRGESEITISGNDREVSTRSVARCVERIQLIPASERMTKVVRI